MKNEIRAILRAASNPKKLNILVIGCTHERYEQALCQTGHDFYCLTVGKEWDRSYGKIPDNYHIVNYIPDYIDFDLILIHRSDVIEIAQELSSKLKIAIIRHTHTVPQSEQEKEYHKNTFAHINTFISKYSMLEWGYEQEFNNGTALYINHGLDTDFWYPDEHIRDFHCLSVVNLWAERDWACGWSLWNKARGDLPVKVLGKNPGLSAPARSIEDLRDSYKKSLIFLNTSLHSPVPMSLLEAMSCGCAVVSTDTCMIPEIIKDNINGVLCNGPEGINTACKYLLEHPARALDLGNAARQTIIKDYNIKSFIKNWNTLFFRSLRK